MFSCWWVSWVDVHMSFCSGGDSRWDVYGSECGRVECGIGGLVV